jgi:quercetin dioxygenase-like cupin family protein
MYPEIINNLPEADIPFKGIKGRLSQAESHQVVFFEIDAVGDLPAHSHGAQWGIVVGGEMDLTIGGETNTYRKGDAYYIPAGVVHSATFREKTWVIDFFEDKNRYNKK